MRDVHKQVGADAVRNLAKALPVDHARIGGEACDDHLRLVLQREPFDLLVVDLARCHVQAVLYGVIKLGAVREVPAVREAHAEDGVAGLQQRHIHHGVGL